MDIHIAVAIVRNTILRIQGEGEMKGKVTNATKTRIVLLINISMLLVSLFSNGLNNSLTLILLGCLIPIWAIDDLAKYDFKEMMRAKNGN